MNPKTRPSVNYVLRFWPISGTVMKTSACVFVLNRQNRNLHTEWIYNWTGTECFSINFLNMPNVFSITFRSILSDQGILKCRLSSIIFPSMSQYLILYVGVLNWHPLKSDAIFIYIKLINKGRIIIIIIITQLFALYRYFHVHMHAFSWV